MGQHQLMLRTEQISSKERKKKFKASCKTEACPYPVETDGLCVKCIEVRDHPERFEARFGYSGFDPNFWTVY